MSVAGKVVVITGASAGLGAATSRLFAQRGAHVVGCGRKVAGGNALASAIDADEEVRRTRGSFRFVPADVTDPAQCSGFIRNVRDHEGRVDVLINNAGGHVPGGVGPSTAVEAAAWDHTMALNLRAVFLCCRDAIEIMRDQPSGGVILNIASVQAEVAIAQMAAYNAAKAAVVQLSRSLAVEFVEQDVRVNSIVLGSVDTAAPTQLRGWLADGVRAADRRNDRSPDAAPPPMRNLELRSQAPERVAAALVALSGDDAALITGATIAIDRALTAGAPLSKSVLDSARSSTSRAQVPVAGAP